AMLERHAAMRKRRPKHPQRVVIQPPAATDEEEGSENFSVSGIRLGTQTRGVAAGPVAADFAALKAKKAFGVMSIHAAGAPVPDWTRHGDPQALAEALTIALGQLQESYDTEDEEEGETEMRSSRTPELEAVDASVKPEDLMDRDGGSGPGQIGRPAARKPLPVRMDQVDTEQGEEGREKVKSGGQDRDDSPFSTWPGGVPKTSRRAPASRSAPSKLAISRSKSLPEKPCPTMSKPDKEKRAGAPGEVAEANQATAEKSSEKTEKTVAADRALSRKATKVGGTPGNLPKSTAAAAAGAGLVAAKVRKKSGPKKMVLPFSYGVDDPRYWHVESTEGRLCPAFLPENRA
ncbi:unnamed protein product, partial [Symbiodinium sp. KB8]